jgi:hypothetical protein
MARDPMTQLHPSEIQEVKHTNWHVPNQPNNVMCDITDHHQAPADSNSVA